MLQMQRLGTESIGRVAQTLTLLKVVGFLCFLVRVREHAFQKFHALHTYLRVHLDDHKGRHRGSDYKNECQTHVHVRMQAVAWVDHAYDPVWHVAERKEQENEREHFAELNFALERPRRQASVKQNKIITNNALNWR